MAVNNSLEPEKKICDVGGKFLTTNDNPRNLEVESGLEFMLGHFSQPLFPRKVSTAVTRNGQKPAVDKGHAMSYFEGALWEECRIEAFGINQTNPDLIFIDIDAEHFASMRSFKLALTKTLKNIKKKIGGHPTVIWSGRGYHIIQPIDCSVNLDEVNEFAALTDSPNNKFLQFAERYLSNGKCDDDNYPAMKSCMLRIPGSLHSECKEAGIDAEVKILQEWDGHRPDYRLLLGSFYADLVGKQQCKVSRIREPFSSSELKGEAIHWIEKLLQTPIDDYRKHARDLILVPYIVLRRGILDETQVSSIVMEWADKCTELRRLDPSRREFEHRIRTRVREVKQDRISQMKWATLQEKNPELCKKLNPVRGD